MGRPVPRVAPCRSSETAPETRPFLRELAKAQTLELNRSGSRLPPVRLPSHAGPLVRGLGQTAERSRHRQSRTGWGSFGLPEPGLFGPKSLLSLRFASFA